MPRLSVWIVKTAVVYLALGFTLGALMLANKGLPLHPAIWSLLPLHIESLLMGWTFQFVMGIEFWILPRFARPPARGNERLVWAGWGLLNAGILAVGLAGFSPFPAALTLAGRAAEAAAVGFVLVSLWPRVKPLGR